MKKNRIKYAIKLDNDMELLPINGLMKGVTYSDKCKRPYLTVIRNITKLKYKMVSSDCTI